MKKTTLLSILLFISYSSSFAQHWVELMQDPKANFYTIQQAFNDYWAGRTIEKGKGYKPFRRWENYMAPRVYPSGDITLPSQNYPNYQEWLKLNQKNGIPKSTAGDWTLIGPVGKPSGGGAGRVNFIRFDPNSSNIIYIGTPDGGLWKTTNGGTNWTCMTDELSVIGCSDIAIDPTNSNTLYLATGDRDGGDTYSIGILKSTDGGITWTNTMNWTPSQGRTIGKILIHPTQTNVLLVFSNAGIFKSTNSGSTWAAPTTGNFSTIDAEFKPGTPNTIYAVGTEFKKSIDGGSNWTSVSTGLTGVSRYELAVTAANANYVYLLAANNTDYGFKGFCRSTDGGATFTTRSTTPNILGWDNGGDSGGQGWYDLSLAASPTNAEEVIIGGINMWKSTNGGTNWTLLSHWTGSYSKPYVHADIHGIEYMPGSGTTIFSGCDGGIFKTTTTGTSWSDISSNLAIAQQYRIGLSTSNPSLIISGHQDNGTNRYNGTSWAQVYGGDGMDCLIDRTNNNIMIGSYVNGDYYRSSNGGTSFTDVVDPPSGDWVSVIHQDPTTATTFYAGGRSQLYKSTNITATSNTWTALGTPTGTGNIIEFVIAPSDNQTIYAIKTGTNGVSKSTNGGTSFTACSTGLPTSVAPTWITVSSTDKNIVYVTYSGYGASNKVYKSTNGGTSWTNLSTGLPNLPVNCVVYHNGSNDAIYVGTDIGVYYRDNSMNGWVEFSTGLPNCAVYELEIYYATNRLRAATFGRGTWDSDLYTSTPSAPTAAFTAPTTTICAGQSITFANSSTGSPTSYSWSFTGGTPSTSTSQNPTIQYNTPGTYTVALTATNANGSNTSTQTNYVTVVANTGTALPLSEGFTSATFPATGWALVNTDGGATTWARSSTVGNAPTTGNCMVFDNYNFDDRGNEDEVQLKKLDLSSYSSVDLKFDVAYAPYNGTQGSYSDGLDVLVSTDCGTTFTQVYSKANTQLATAAAASGAFTPTSTQWRTETISLSSYIGQSGVIIAFRNIAGYGNKLYVDNINVTGSAVSTPPTASFTSSPSSAGCTGQTITYTSTSTGSPTSYSWTFTGGTPSTSTAQNPTVTYATAGSYAVSLTVTNSAGTNTSNQTNFITVSTTPSISSSTPGSRCGAGTVQLAAVSTAGTINWYNAASGGTLLGSGTSFTTPSISSSTTYYAEAVSGACSSSRTSVLATINAQPTVTTPANQSVCLGSNSTVISFSGSNNNSTYDWTNSNTAIGLSAAGTGTISPFTGSQTGTATITVTPSLNGCTGSSQSFTITVNPLPVVTLGTFNDVCVNYGSFSLTGGSPAGGSYSGTGVTNNTFNPAASGVGTFPVTYSVTQNGCSNTASSNITVNACAGVEDLTESALSIYPNPSTGLLTVESSDLVGYETIQLVDAAGRVVETWKIHSTKMEIDLYNHAAGNYTLRLDGFYGRVDQKVQLIK